MLTTATSPELRPFGRNRFLQCLALAYGAVWVWAAIAPLQWFDWLLENLLVVIAVVSLSSAQRRYPFSELSYLLIAIFMALHTVGSHYTYAEVPLAAWFGDIFVPGRNHYDRLVHFLFGLLISYPLWECFVRYSNIRGFWCYFLPFAIIAGASNFYEFLEWCVAIIVAPDAALAFLGTQGDVFDAQKDTGLAITGAVICLIATACLGRPTPPEKAG